MPNWVVWVLVGMSGLVVCSCIARLMGLLWRMVFALDRIADKMDNCSLSLWAIVGLMRGSGFTAARSLTTHKEGSETQTKPWMMPSIVTSEDYMNQQFKEHHKGEAKREAERLLRNLKG